MCLAIPGKIVSIAESNDPLLRAGKVNFGGVCKEVSLAYVPEADLEDYVIVHVGFALSIIDPEEAKHTLDLIQSMQPQTVQADLAVGIEEVQSDRPTERGEGH
ncbi:MAG: HypC/HybG/HupF family hydrogenase formation chaperone [Thermosynechococcaceae cyanobacterium]